MAKTWTIKTGRKTPAGDPETLNIKALKADTEQLTRAIKDMIATAQHKKELRGTIGDPHSERTTKFYTPFSFNAIADPEAYRRDVELFFHSLQAWTPELEPGTAPQYRTITAEQIPGIIAQAAAIFNKHMPIEDLRTTPEQQAAEAAERAAMRARHEAEAAERAAQQEADAAAIRQAEEYKFLTPMSATPNKSRHAAGAANLKTELTRKFPGVVFKVVSSSFSMGDDIRAAWTDGPTAEAVRPIINRYQQGSFDGMTDSYTYTHSAFIDRFGGAKYVFGERTESPALIIRAAAELGHTIPSTETTGNDFYNYISGILDRDTVQEIYRHARSMDATPSPSPSPEAQQAQDDTTPEPGRYGATMRRNPEKNGIEIKFSEKPDTQTLDTLKAAGFRWSKFQKLWYAKESSRTAETARKICGQTPEAEQAAAPARREPLTVTGKSHFNSFTAIKIAGITAELSRNQYDDKNGYVIMTDVIAKSERMQKWNRCSISNGADDVYLNAYAAGGRISYFTLDAPAQLLTAPRKTRYDMADVFTPEQARALIENKLKKQLRIITEQEHDAERDRIHAEAGYTPPAQQQEGTQTQAPTADPETIIATAAALRATLDSKPQQETPEERIKDAAAILAARYEMQLPDHAEGYFYSTQNGFVSCRACQHGDDWIIKIAWSHKNPICGSIGSNATFSGIEPADAYLSAQIDRLQALGEQPEPEAAPETMTEAEPDAAQLAAYIATLQQRDTYRPDAADTRGPIPETTPQTLFYDSGRYSPAQVLGWTFDTTFNKWRALVIFSDGTRTITDPAPEPPTCSGNQLDCDMCATTDNAAYICSRADDAEAAPETAPPAILHFRDCDACGRPTDDAEQILCQQCRPTQQEHATRTPIKTIWDTEHPGTNEPLLICPPPAMSAGAATRPEPRQPAEQRAARPAPVQISLF